MIEKNETDEREKYNLLEKEVESLKKDNALLRAEITRNAMFFREINSISFAYDSANDKVVSQSDDSYFETLFEKDFLLKILSGNLNSYNNVHPLDKVFLVLLAIYLKEHEIEANISGIFRYKSKDSKYRWLYIKIHRKDKSDIINIGKCKGLLTIFDDNMQSKEQIKMHSIAVNREKYSYLIEDFNIKELEIIKYLIDGKSRKDIQTLMGFRSLSALNNIIEDLFIKTKTSNATSLVCFFINLGII
jgi:DNA-binding CsgD family transcriptional regulator